MGDCTPTGIPRDGGEFEDIYDSDSHLALRIHLGSLQCLQPCKSRTGNVLCHHGLDTHTIRLLENCVKVKAPTATGCGDDVTPT